MRGKFAALIPFTVPQTKTPRLAPRCFYFEQGFFYFRLKDAQINSGNAEKFVLRDEAHHPVAHFVRATPPGETLLTKY
jgi:hypothetical protein